LQSLIQISRNYNSQKLAAFSEQQLRR